METDDQRARVAHAKGSYMNMTERACSPTRGFSRFAAIAILSLCIVAKAAGSADAQVRVPGFRPSTHGFAFSNSFPVVPHTVINVGVAQIPIGNAANGLCGGMAFAVRDYFEAGLTRPAQTTPPSSGPLYDHIVGRLYDSFNLPGGPLTYLHLMNPDLPDHETWWSMNFGPHGRGWVTIMEQWPGIRADLDAGRLSPIALIRVKSHDPFMMGQNHQVLAWGYDLIGNDLTIYVYDPNEPNNDYVTISLNIGNPTATTDMFYSTGAPLFAFFRPAYGFTAPFGLTNGRVFRDLSSAPVFAIVGGAKLWITSPWELETYFGGWGNVTVVADGVAAAIGDLPFNGTVVRETSRPEVKVMENGRDRWITSPAVLDRYGGWGVVRLVPSGSLAPIPDGSPIY
jgi:hypothetical protein